MQKKEDAHFGCILFFYDYLESCYLHIGCDEVNKLNLKNRKGDGSNYIPLYCEKISKKNSIKKELTRR